MTTWSEPDLGTFRFEDDAWTITVNMPAFKSFQFCEPGRNNGTSNIAIEIGAESASKPPPPPLIALAKQVVERQESLAVQLKQALFDDFQGNGPDSGMWWHGDIATIKEEIAAESQQELGLIGPNDLDELLGSPSIRIRDRTYGYDHPCAILGFEALFELEHGIGILTDGHQIFGTGYYTDVSPFS